MLPLYANVDYGLDRPVTLDEVKPGFLDHMGAVWDASLALNPSIAMRNLYRVSDFTDNGQASDADLFEFAREYLEAEKAAAMPLPDQDARIRDAGLEEHLKARKGYTQEALEYIIEAKKNEIFNARMSDGQPWWHLIPSLGVGLFAGMMDPVNLASAFMPVPGMKEAQVAKLLGNATRAARVAGKSGALRRAGIYAAHGAASGLLGAAVVEPLVYAGQQAVQANYDIYSSIMNVGGGAALGALLRSGTGFLGEWRRRAGHRPQAWEYVPRTAESAAMMEAHEEKIFNVLREHIERLTDEERAKSDIAALNEEGLRTRAKAWAISFDSHARNYAWMTQTPVKDFYDRATVDYRTGEVVDLARGGGLYQFAGEKGMARADAADGGARLANLEVAKKMERASYGAATIKMATGWERGADGKWRYEIPDGKIRENLTLTKEMHGSELRYSAKLGNLLDSPETFSAYPELKDLTVYFLDEIDERFGGYFDVNNKEIVLRKEYLTDNEENPDMLRQQKRYEKIWNSPEYKEFLEKIKKADDAEEDELEDALRAELKNDKIGRELEELDKNFFSGEIQNVELAPFVSEALFHEIQHYIQHKEGFVSGGHPDSFTTVMGGLKQDKLAKGNETYDELMALPEEQRYNYYLRVAGETEARNVQARKNMRPYERRMSLAEETEDVARNRQIVVNDEGVAAMAHEEKPRVAKVVEVDPSLLVHEDGRPVDLFSRSDMMAWLKKNLQGKIIIIANDGTIQKFIGKGLDASLKRRGLEHSQAYANLDTILENSLFDTFEYVDARHEGKVSGQNIYYSAIKIGDKYFSIRIKVDIPLKKGWKAYKDHKITEIEIAPSLYLNSAKNASLQQNENAITGISLEILKGDVKPSRIENNTLLQSSRPNALAGNQTTIKGQNISDAAHYEVWELSDIIASHDPLNGFVRRKDYPASAQERPYHSDRGEQDKVRANSRVYDPEFVLNTDPTAQNGPPVITDKGIVLGGNSRAMTLSLVYGERPEAAKAYRAKLQERAEAFGIEPDAISSMKEPVLVRVLDDAIAEADFPRKSREYNQTTTQTLQANAEAISRGKFVTDASLGLIDEGLGNFESLSDFLKSAASRRLVDSLLKDGAILQTEYSSMTIPQGILNERGRDLVTGILRGMAVPDYDVVSMLPGSIGQKLDRIASAVVRTRALNAEWDISATLTDALRLLNNAHMNGDLVAKRLGQKRLMPGDEIKPAIQILALAMEREDSAELFARFELYANEAKYHSAPQNMLMGPTTQASAGDVFRKAFMKDIASVGKKPLGSFIADGPPLHQAIAWAKKNGGKNPTVKSALEKAQKRLEKAKTPEEKAILEIVRQELGGLDGKIGVWKPAFDDILKVDDAYALELSSHDQPLELARRKVEEPASPEAPQEPVAPPRASVNIKETGSALITLFRSADLSSIPHELSHVMRMHLEQAANMPGVDPAMKEYWQSICDFVGAKVGEKWSREMEEKFARAAERFLFEGVAPNARLEKPFEIMKEDLGRIYADADAAGLFISPEMRDVFNSIYSISVDAADAQFREAYASLRNMEWERDFAPSPEADANWRKNFDEANAAELEQTLRQERQMLDDGLARLESEAPPEFQELLQAARKELADLDRDADIALASAKLFPDYVKCLLS